MGSCWGRVTVVKASRIFFAREHSEQSEKWNCWKVYGWKRWVTECYPVACRKWPVDFAYLRQRRRELVGLVGLCTHTCATWLTQGTTRTATPISSTPPSTPQQSSSCQRGLAQVQEEENFTTVRTVVLLSTWRYSNQASPLTCTHPPHYPWAV